MRGEFVQVNSVARADADGGDVALDRLGLVHDQNVESRIGLVKRVSQAGRVVVARVRPPFYLALESEDALLGVAFDGVFLRLDPDSGGSHR